MPKRAVLLVQCDVPTISRVVASRDELILSLPIASCEWSVGPAASLCKTSPNQSSVESIQPMSPWPTV